MLLVVIAREQATEAILPQAQNRLHNLIRSVIPNEVRNLISSFLTELEKRLRYARNDTNMGINNPSPLSALNGNSGLLKSWARLFREEILSTPPVEKVFSFYNTTKGAPTKELHAMILAYDPPRCCTI